jgi:hypothetical protein
MSRKLRIEYPGAMYHVMNRGDQREDIFRDDQDRQGRGQTGDLSREGLILGGRYRGQRLRRPCWAILLLPPSVRRLAESATPEDGAVAFLPIRFPVARHGCV